MIYLLLINYNKLYYKNRNNRTKGFTLIEILIVISLIALLATAVIVSVNPVRQFKFARDTERKAHLSTILNAIGQNLAEHNGVFKCNGEVVTLPATSSIITSSSGTLSFDMANCIVPEYLAKMPFDPKLSNAHFENLSDYNTGYKVSEDIYGHITLSATSEISPNTDIALTR